MRTLLRDILGAIAFLAALALAYVATAQPALHIVHGRENEQISPARLAPSGGS